MPGVVAAPQSSACLFVEWKLYSSNANSILLLPPFTMHSGRQVEARLTTVSLGQILLH